MRVSNNTEWLFFHLWKKNPDTLLPCPNIYLAETILYRWAQPYFWYFTAKDGLLVRKTKEKVLLQQIEESFLNHVPQCKVVAQCLTSVEDSNKTQETIEFEYVESNNFHSFLFQREKPLNIIIQRFIEPKNNRNSLIKVSWTPQFCLFYRKTNLHELTNPRVPLANKLVTFEGMEHLSQSDSISSPILGSELEQTCFNIVKHINAVTGGNVQISKMVLYFKLDDKNRLWLLFCTDMKLREKIHSNVGPQLKKRAERPLSPMMVLASKKEDAGFKQHMPSEYYLEDQVFQTNTDACLRCNSEGILYDVNMRLVIDHEEKVMKGEIPEVDEFESNVTEKQVEGVHDDVIAPVKALPEFVKREKIDKSKLEGIPKIMIKLYPNINKERYQKLKKNVSLLSMEVKVCEVCYLKITSNMLENTEEHIAKKYQQRLKENSKKNNAAFGFNNLAENNKGVKPQESASATVIPGTGTNSTVNRTPKRQHSIMTDLDLSPSKFDSLPKLDDIPKKSMFAGSQKLPPIEDINTGNQIFLPDLDRNGSLQNSKSQFEELNYPMDLTKDYFYREPAQLEKNRTTGNLLSKINFVRSPYATDMKLKVAEGYQQRAEGRMNTSKEFSYDKSRKSEEPTKIWSDPPTSGGMYRNNYGSVLSTLRDLRAYISDNLDDLKI